MCGAYHACVAAGLMASADMAHAAHPNYGDRHEPRHKPALGGGPVSSGATGEFHATIDDAANEIHYTESYSGLEGTVTQSHIHFGQRSVSGGICVALRDDDESVSQRVHADMSASGNDQRRDHLEVVGPGGQGSPPASSTSSSQR